LKKMKNNGTTSSHSLFFLPNVNEKNDSTAKKVNKAEK